MDLFQNFDRMIRNAIAGEIRRGRLGQLTTRLASMGDRAGRGRAGRLIRQIARQGQARIERFTGDTLRQARDTVWRMLREAMEPVANLLRGLAGSFGGGGGNKPPAPPAAAPMPGGAPDPIRSNLDKSIRDAIELLEAQGYTVTPPGQAAPRPGVSTPEDFGFTAAPTFPEQRQDSAPDTVRVGGRTRKADPTDPVFSGEMVPVTSSNVHSIGFIWNTADPMKGTLKVRFLQGGSKDTKKTAGPLYYYFNVHPDVFDAFLRANSKGSFVWDRLRIRGTVSGHRYHYELKGITNGYVPRKATRLGKNEYFLGRSAKFRNGNTGEVREFSSSLPDQFVQNLGGGPGNMRRGPGGFVPTEPYRGQPNRGRPNRGKR